MFDAHIQYYAYNNVEGDDFGVGYLGNKADWIERINRWGQNSGTRDDFDLEYWDELDYVDLQGVELAEVEPTEDGYIVTWYEGEYEQVIKINKKHEVSFKQNPKKLASVPRWTGRLKTMLKEANIQ